MHEHFAKEPGCFIPTHISDQFAPEINLVGVGGFSRLDNWIDRGLPFCSNFGIKIEHTSIVAVVPVSSWLAMWQKSVVSKI